jgi:hypothetical protein
VWRSEVSQIRWCRGVESLKMGNLIAPRERDGLGGVVCVVDAGLGQGCLGAITMLPGKRG